MILINVNIYAPTTWHNVTGIIARILFHTFHTKHSIQVIPNWHLKTKSYQEFSSQSSLLGRNFQFLDDKIYKLVISVRYFKPDSFIYL